MGAKSSGLLAAVSGFFGLGKAQSAPEPAGPEAVSPEMQAAIDGNVALVQGAFAQDVGVVFDFGRPSLEWLDGFITRTRGGDPGSDHGNLPSIFGSYLGECIRHRDGGRWVCDPDGLVGLEIVPHFKVYPFAKAQKQYDGGEGDSILGLYDAVPALLDAHRRGELGRK